MNASLRHDHVDERVSWFGARVIRFELIIQYQR
jgi:hypothetical protein